jgi:hypothetical protein
MADMTYAVHTATCTYLLDDEGTCLWTLSPSGHAAPGTDRCVGAQFVASLDLLAPGGLVGELRLGACALFVRREHGKFVLLRTLPIENVEHRARTEEEARVHREVLNSQEATAVLADLPGHGLEETPQTQPLPAHGMPAHLPPALRRVPPPPPLPGPRAAGSPPTAPAQVTPAAPWVDPALAARAWAVATADRAARVSPRVIPPPPPAVAAELAPESGELLDAEELMSISVTEVTLTLPLYRQPATLPPPAAPQLPLAQRHHSYELPQQAPPQHAPPQHAQPQHAQPQHAPPQQAPPQHAQPHAYAPPPYTPPQYAPPAPAAALPPPVAPPRRQSSFPPPPVEDAAPTTPRGPPPARRGVVGPGRRLR